MAVITSTTNPIVKAARRLARERDDGRVLVEGPQVVRSALPYLERLFVIEGQQDAHAELVAAAAQHGATVSVVSERVLAALADTVTPQSVAGVAVLPRVDLETALDVERGPGGNGATPPFVVCLWEVADPGNAGTAVRTADAAGAHAVVATADSVDFGNPKAVRASAGSVFHLPLCGGADGGDLVAAARRHGLQVVATAGAAETAYTAADLRAPALLLFGNEAHGLPASVQGAADALIRVPLHRRRGGSAESLNLAATVAVVCFEAARQRAQDRPALLGAASPSRQGHGEAGEGSSPRPGFLGAPEAASPSRRADGRGDVGTPGGPGFLGAPEAASPSRRDEG